MTTTQGNIPSSPIYSLNLPDPTKLQARFIYRYFTKDEDSDEDNLNQYTEPYFKELYGSPRSILLEFDGFNSMMAHTNTLAAMYANAIDAVLTTENIEKITSEIMLQSSGYTKVSSNVASMQNFVQNASAGTATNTIDAFFAGASTSVNLELFQELITDMSVPIPMYTNPSTGLPTINAKDSAPVSSTQSFIATDFVYDVIEASTNNPFSMHAENLSEDLKESKAAQFKQRKSVSPILVDLGEYNLLADPVDLSGLDDVTSTGLGGGIVVIGYIIFKYDITSGTPEPKQSIVIVNGDDTQFTDYNVKYGAKYRYSIRPLCIIRESQGHGLEAHTIPPIHLLLVGTQAKTVDLPAIELVPPPPIEAIQFDWDGVKLNLRWGMPMSQVNDAGGPIGDIKGYQIFTRATIDKPFKLKRMLNFYDGFSSLSLNENINGLITNSSVPINNYSMDIEPDSEHIIAICVIDAHGNSSNLSPQYKIKLDSYRNVITVEFVSFKGAPKQYPNFMMSDKIFLDAIKVSSSTKMSIFYKPDETNISTTDGSAFETTNGVDGAITPSYRLQIINTNSQSGEILDIFLPNS